MLDANGRRFEETSGYPYAEIFSTPFRWDPAGMVLDLGVPLRLPKGLTWSLEAELYVYPLGLNSEGAAIDMHYDTQYRPWEKESKAVGLLFRESLIELGFSYDWPVSYDFDEWCFLEAPRSRAHRLPEELPCENGVDARRQGPQQRQQKQRQQREQQQQQHRQQQQQQGHQLREGAGPAHSGSALLVAAGGGSASAIESTLAQQSAKIREQEEKLQQQEEKLQQQEDLIKKLSERLEKLEHRS